MTSGGKREPLEGAIRAVPGDTGTPVALPWHASPGADVLLAVGGDATGLSDAEAGRRLAHYGPNLLTVTPAESAWRILVRQVRSVVVGLPVVATVLAWWTSDVVDASAILTVLLLNVAIGFATELRARRAMDALLRLDAPVATVVRQGNARTVDGRELVPGDIVELEPGQAIPADAFARRDGAPDHRGITHRGVDRTIAMAIAARRMARRHALVRRLPAVETLGSVTVVCTDKTGTLTAGQQTVTTMWLPDVEIAVTDDGTRGGGGFATVGGPLAPTDQQRLREALSIGVLAKLPFARLTR